jgi:hypothetical protein
VRFIDPAFAYLKIACFLVFQGTLVFLVGALGWFLWTSPSKKPRPHRGHASGEAA